MKTELKTPQNKAVIEQTVNNTTSWIGHRSADNEDVVSGQTFIVLIEGNLNEIEVFSSLVTKPGKVIMTLYDFDLSHNSWGHSLGSASVDINASKTGKWVAFSMPHLHLNKGKSYGFRLECPDSYIGVGEAASSAQTQSYNLGQEWQFTKKEKAGHSYSYFSLAFKVGMTA
jgi:hypothetical protein